MDQDAISELLNKFDITRQGSKTDANKPENFFVAGGVINATLVQSDGKWKISQMSNAVLWRAGGFRDMLQTGATSKDA